jgi:hypothetical protein
MFFVVVGFVLCVCVCVFNGTGVWAQGLTLARQVIYLEPLCQLFCIGHFWDRAYWILPGLAVNFNLPDLCLLSTQEYRNETLAPGPMSSSSLISTYYFYSNNKIIFLSLQLNYFSPAICNLSSHLFQLLNSSPSYLMPVPSLLPFTGIPQWSCQFTTSMARGRVLVSVWPSWSQPSGY